MAKKVFTGTVVSNKAQGSAVVAIERKVAHPKYGKLLKRTKKIMVDASSFSEVRIGTVVKIEETKPLSKNKNFKIIKIIKEVLDGSA